MSSSVARVSPDLQSAMSELDINDKDPSFTASGPRIFTLTFPDRPDPGPMFYLNQAWEKLKPAIRIVFLDEPEDFNCTEIFNAVHDAWREKSGETLYKMILDECGTYTSAAIQSLEVHCDDDDPSVFLTLMEKCWLDFKRKMCFFCSFAGGEGKRIYGRTLSELCIHEIFPMHLCMATKVVDKLLSNILQLINYQRSGKPVNVVQLNNLMDMFNGVSYDKSRYFFEKPFLQGTAEFYAEEALQVLEHSDLSQYLKHVEKRLLEENERCKHLYFFIEFDEQLIEVVERELLEVHAASFLEKGFAKLMKENCVDDLQRLYGLFSQANLVAYLSDALRSYILKTGREMLAKGLSVASFKVSVERICHSYFLQDESLENTIDECFMDLGLPKKDRLNADIL